MSLQLIGLLALALAFPSPPLGWSEESAATTAQASLLFAHGDVSIRAQGGEWQAAQRGATLPVGTEVRVGPQASAEIAYDLARTKVSRLDKEGVAVIEEVGQAGVRVRLVQGRLFNIVAPLSAGEHFIVQTPAAVASVRGTVFEGEHDREKGSTFAVHDQGDAEEHAVLTQALNERGEPITGTERVIGEGTQSAVKDGAVTEPEPLPPEKHEAAQQVLKEVQQRVQETAPAEGAQQSTMQGPPPPGAPPTTPLAGAPTALTTPSTTPMGAVAGASMPGAAPNPGMMVAAGPPAGPMTPAMGMPSNAQGPAPAAGTSSMLTAGVQRFGPGPGPSTTMPGAAPTGTPGSGMTRGQMMQLAMANTAMPPAAAPYTPSTTSTVAQASTLPAAAPSPMTAAAPMMNTRGGLGSIATAPTLAPMASTAAPMPTSRAVAPASTAATTLAATPQVAAPIAASRFAAPTTAPTSAPSVPVATSRGPTPMTAPVATTRGATPATPATPATSATTRGATPAVPATPAAITTRWAMPATPAMPAAIATTRWAMPAMPATPATPAAPAAPPTPAATYTNTPSATPLAAMPDPMVNILQIAGSYVPPITTQPTTSAPAPTTTSTPPPTTTYTLPVTTYTPPTTSYTPPPTSYTPPETTYNAPAPTTTTTVPPAILTEIFDHFAHINGQDRAVYKRSDGVMVERTSPVLLNERVSRYENGRAIYNHFNSYNPYVEVESHDHGSDGIDKFQNQSVIHAVFRHSDGSLHSHGIVEWGERFDHMENGQAIFKHADGTMHDHGSLAAGEIYSNLEVETEIHAIHRHGDGSLHDHGRVAEPFDRYELQSDNKYHAIYRHDDGTLHDHGAVVDDPSREPIDHYELRADGHHAIHRHPDGSLHDHGVEAVP